MKNPMKSCLMTSLIFPLFVNNDPIYTRRNPKIYDFVYDWKTNHIRHQ